MDGVHGQGRGVAGEQGLRAEGLDRLIGLAWRKGSNRIEEFKLLGRFLVDNRA